MMDDRRPQEPDGPIPLPGMSSVRPGASEQSPVPAQPPAGMLSEDGRWRWTGKEWVEVGPSRSPAPSIRSAREQLRPELVVKGPVAAPEQGWQAGVHRLSGGRLKVRAGKAELHDRELVALAQTRVVEKSAAVAVASGKGGVGKSTVSGLMTTQLATLRGDRAIALEANPDCPTLSLRVKTETTATIRDLLDHIEDVRDLSDVRAYTTLGGDRLELLASALDPQIMSALTGEHYAQVMKLLKRYYNLVVADLGTGLLDPTNAYFLRTADQLVVVSEPASDSIQIAGFTVEHVAALRGDAWVHDHVVLVVNGVRPREIVVDLPRFQATYAPFVRAIRTIRWDPHLAAGAFWSWRHISIGTRHDYLELAAEVARGFASQTAEAELVYGGERRV